MEGEIMDISLNYFGGSGGFYALWHILLEMWLNLHDEEERKL
jgi:hypothetical protein